MPDPADLFSADGALAAAFPGYRVRNQQIEMAQRVADAIANQRVLIAEAGTGTGKTLAYLVPALLSGGKVILSTGTRNLQDQLFHRDLPAVRAALASPVVTALLKGRANYICHYHLERALNEGSFAQRETARHVIEIKAFAEHSKTGDKSLLGSIAEDAPVWNHVTSTRENCLGSECEHFRKCFVFEARKQAMEADIVVVNHHLFFADVWLRDEGVAELLPACNTVVFDEAHQLPETAGLFFGENLSTSQLIVLARDTRLEAAVHCKDFPALGQAAQTLDRAARDFRLAFREEGSRWNHDRAMKLEACSTALQKCIDTTSELEKLLQSQASRAPSLEQAATRCTETLALLRRWQQHDDPRFVRWLEVYSQAVVLNATPLSVAEIFASQINGNARSWIFTSATLSVKGDFSHYRSQLGLPDAEANSWDSPFDYASQAMLYVPRDMPDPNDSSYTSAVVANALPLLEASQGRAFLLFTSLRAMKEAQGLLREALQARGLDYPLLMQGDCAKAELLERFRALEHPVLLGSQSFWEGVDVKGDALSLVVIDRLPFSPPDDPVLAARIDSIRASGGNPFMDYQLPHAVITLKQGAGRLIRDEHDHGVLMICDPRLVDKPYGRRIWQSLPPMSRSRDAQEAATFLHSRQTITSP